MIITCKYSDIICSYHLGLIGCLCSSTTLITPQKKQTLLYNAIEMKAESLKWPVWQKPLDLQYMTKHWVITALFICHCKLEKWLGREVTWLRHLITNSKLLEVDSECV